MAIWYVGFLGAVALGRGWVAPAVMDGWGPSGERYLRLVFANESAHRLRDLRERFATAF